MVREVEEARALKGARDLLGYLKAGGRVAVEKGAEVDQLDHVSILCMKIDRYSDGHDKAILLDTRLSLAIRRRLFYGAHAV